MSLLACLLAVQAVKASRHRPASVSRSMLLVFLICGKVICFVWQWVLFRLAMGAVSFSNCCCFVWQLSLFCLAIVVGGLGLPIGFRPFLAWASREARE